MNTARHLRVRVRPRWETVTYWSVALVPVAFVLLLPALVLQDGGLHLSSAAVLEGLLTGRWTELIDPRPGLPPNLLVELLMLGLIQFLDPNWALRVVVVLALLAFAAAGQMFVRSVGAPVVAAMLFLPFAMHYMLFLGFIGLTMAVPLAMATIALILRDPGRRNSAAVSSLLVATWLTHLVPAVIATMVVVLVVFLHHATRSHPGTATRLVTGARRTVGSAGLAVLPVVALTAYYVLGNLLPAGGDGEADGDGGGGGDGAGVGIPLTSDLVKSATEVIGMTLPMASYADAEYEIVRLLALVLWLLAGWAFVYRTRMRQVDHRDGLLAGTALSGIVAILVNQDTDFATYVNSRLALFLPLLLVGWLISIAGSHGAPSVLDVIAPARRVAILAVASVVAAVATVSLAVVRYPALAELGDDLDELRTLTPCVPSGSTMVQLNLSYGGVQAVRVRPMVEQSGHIAVDRDVLDLSAEWGWLAHSLWRYTDAARADRDLATDSNGMHTVPPRVDLSAALESGLPLDVVIVQGRPDADDRVVADPLVVEMQADLDADFHLVAVSATGVGELWLRTGVDSPCVADSTGR